MMTASPCADQARFLELLPLIQKQARVAFRGHPAERRGELIAEVVANAWIAFKRLVERGLERVVYATPLAQYAIRQVRAGRRVGNKLNVRDVTSEHCQRAKGVRVRSLDDQRPKWKEVLVEDRRATPAEVAAWRIDFGDWLRSLPYRERKVAKRLATGEKTTAVARRMCITPGRVSQIRRALERTWKEFQGEGGLDGGVGCRQKWPERV